MIEVVSITVSELQRLAENSFGDMVKAVVDIELGKMVLDAELHADLEQLMLDNGSKQSDLWGINLHPANAGKADFIEFDSLINIRPRQKNYSRDIQSEEIKRQVREVVKSIVKFI